MNADHTTPFRALLCFPRGRPFGLLIHKPIHAHMHILYIHTCTCKYRLYTASTSSDVKVGRHFNGALWNYRMTGFHTWPYIRHMGYIFERTLTFILCLVYMATQMYLESAGNVRVQQTRDRAKRVKHTALGGYMGYNSHSLKFIVSKYIICTMYMVYMNTSTHTYIQRENGLSKCSR